MIFPNPAAFQDPNTLSAWTEPKFFLLRNSSKTGWIIRGVFFCLIFGGFAVLLTMENGNPGRAPLGWVETAILSGVIAVFMLVSFELPTMQRQVSITKNSISCDGGMMAMFGGLIHLLQMGWDQWNLREIKKVRLLRAGEGDNSFGFGLMTIYRKYSKEKSMGVAADVSLEELADLLHSMELDVELSDWSPAPAEP